MLVFLLLVVVPELTRAESSLYSPPSCASVERATAETLLRCFAPAFVVVETEHSYNRIASPEIHRAWPFGVRVQMDPEDPALFGEIRQDQLAGRPVLQLVYRIHFEKIPLRFSRYFFEAHRNPGLLFVVTLDAQTRAPLFITAAHTCGCYLAVIPTDRVDPAWLPEAWPEVQAIYGQRLPGRLPAPSPQTPLWISLQSHSHRVTGVGVGDPVKARRASGSCASEVELPLRPIGDLRRMQVVGAPEGETASIFYSSGPLRGKVRGAWNPLEGLTAFGLLSLDPTVGMDKDFGDPTETGTPFYTLLPFWLHGVSRLDQFDTLLRTLGFRLPRGSDTVSASAGRVAVPVRE